MILRARFLLSLSFVFVVSFASAADWFVASTGSPGVSPDFSGSTAIQLAVDAAADGDTIHVAGGSYDHVIMDDLDKDLVIVADNWDPAFTGTAVIEPQPGGSNGFVGVFIVGGQTKATMICGLKIQGWMMASVMAAGMQVHPTLDSLEVGASPQIINCTFQNNTTNHVYGAGGLGIGKRCNPLVKGCRFIDNVSTLAGGMAAAMRIAAVSAQGVPCPPLSDWPDPVIDTCVFDSNEATHPDESTGAVTIECGIGTFRRCLFRNNIAGESGGAFYTDDAQGTLIEDCQFTGNVARRGFGGAIYINGSASNRIRIIRNTFQGNRAVRAGAVCVVENEVTISHNCFSSNVVDVDPDPNFPPIATSVAASAIGIRTKDDTEGETVSSPLIVNNLFSNNLVDLTSSPPDSSRSVVRVFIQESETTINALFLNNTFADNADRAIVASDSGLPAGAVNITLLNDLYWDNSPSQDFRTILLDGGGLASLAGDSVLTDQIETLPGVTNVIAGLDPLFSGNTYELTVASPAHDSGVNSNWNMAFLLDPLIPNADKSYDNLLRIQEGTIDRGAYEVAP